MVFGSGTFVWTCLCLLQNQNKQAVIFTKAQMYFHFLQSQTNSNTKVLKNIGTKMCQFFSVPSPPFYVCRLFCAIQLVCL